MPWLWQKTGGITVIEGKRCEFEGYDSLIRVEMKSDSNDMVIDGVISRNPRLC